MNPAASGLQGPGVAMELSADAQLNFINNTFPDFNRVAVIYSTQRQQTVAEELSRLKSGGRNLLLFNVNQPGDLGKVMKDIFAAAPDCLLIMPDPDVFSPTIFANILKESLEKRLPVIAPSPGVVRGGAVAGVWSDMKADCFEAADMAEKIALVNSGEDAGIHLPTKALTMINMPIVKLLNVKVNPSALRKSEVIQ
jgi:ABC-type uncharacterized transport system substrate-binding protein